MKKILYHGSQYQITVPQYGKGSRNNDYGRGFYCTENLELAKEWACAKNTDGFANRYELVIDDLKVMNLNSASYNILNWLALLTQNRTYWQNSSISEEAKRYLKENFLPEIAGYDVIIGYRADDSYFSFAQDFVAGTISLQKLSEAMRLGNLGEQVVLKSEKAFERIHFLDSTPVSAEDYYSRKAARDREARRQYRNTKKRTADISELYMLDIMREGIQNGDTRLR